MTSLLPPPTWPPLAPPPDDRYGRATISPAEPVVAGGCGTWTLTYTAGPYGIDDGGALRIAFHTISDWGAPQFHDPAAPDYCTIRWSTPAPGRIVTTYEPDLGVRPWKRTLVLRVRDQAVRPGDTIAVTLGDRSGGSPGARTQTFAGLMRFQVLLDAYGTGIFVPAGQSPARVPRPATGLRAWDPAGQPVALQIVAGAPHHLRVHAPSDVAAGERFTLTVAARDRWGNVTHHFQQTETLAQPGTQTVTVTDTATGLVGESNPIRVHTPGSRPAHRVFWGDLHAQTEETIGSGTLDDYFTFARQCAAVDFAGHQGNDFQVTRAVWDQIMAKTQAYDAANEFITFAGYEWSGNTPGGGDHNVHFKGGAQQRYDLHRSGHWQIADRSDEATDRYPVSDLYAAFRGREDVLLIPHVGGRYANLTEFFDESLMPLVEIASCWGVFEWFVDDAFRRGATFGFSAGSDDHTARPGMSHAPRGHFAIGGGLTAVLATERSREALWEAIKARRTYATTGARMLLELQAGAGGHEAMMGGTLSLGRGHAGQMTFTGTVHGTAPLWRVELLRWPEVVWRLPLPAPAPAEPARDRPEPGRHRLRLGWTGSRIRARNRLTTWDGALTVETGRLRGAEGWGFDQPEQGIVAQDERSVRWCSETAGDWDGIVVDVEAPDDAQLVFASGPATFRFCPRDLAAGPLEVDAGGVGQQVRVERDPGPQQPRHVAVQMEDAPPPGRHAYVLRVTQQDGHIGWTSPIFVSVD